MQKIPLRIPRVKNKLQLIKSTIHSVELKNAIMLYVNSTLGMLQGTRQPIKNNQKDVENTYLHYI